MKTWIWRHGLSLVMFGLFAVFWVAQLFVGRITYNDDRADRGASALTMKQYLGSAHLLEATAENWESEFLQMGSYIFLTAYLFQKGSAESKDPDGPPTAEDEDPRLHRHDPKAPWPVRRGGFILKLYENSLALAFLALFAGAVALHAAGGAQLYSEEQLAHGKEAVDFVGYLGTAQFWFESLQNWQSEFLAIGSMAVLSIFLRQRGSPESKPVAAPTWENAG